MAKKAGQGAPPTATAAPPPSDVPGAPERRLTDDEFKEALYRRLMAGHREVDARIAEIMSGLKTIKKQRTAFRNQLNQAGYLLSNVDNILDDSGKTKEPRHKQQSKVDQLHWMREIEGLPNPKTGEQLDLMARLPDTERDAIAWEEDAYHHGVVGNACEIPAGCPPIFHQRWMKKWGEGEDRRKWALATEVNTERDPERAAAVGVQPVKLDPEPDDDEEETCPACKGDGTGLSDDELVCDACGAEYEPPLLEGAPTDSAFNGDPDPGAALDEPAGELVH